MRVRVRTECGWDRDPTTIFPSRRAPSRSMASSTLGARWPVDRITASDRAVRPSWVRVKPVRASRSVTAWMSMKGRL